MEDKLNPDFLFNMTHTELLLRIANGEIDPVDHAKQQLINRGIGKSGVWVGFGEARRQWNMPEKLPATKRNS